MGRIIKSSIIIIILASVASGASWGFFSDQETSVNNVFSAGTVEIDATHGGSGTISASGMTGGSCRNGLITAENKGSLPAYFWLNISSHSGNPEMWNNLELFVEDDDTGESIFGGLLKDFEKVRVSDAVNSSNDPIPAGGTQNIFYEICLPCVENLQGKTLSWSFEMMASSGANDFVSAPFSEDDRPSACTSGGGGTI